jgi:hypothetical protein
MPAAASIRHGLLLAGRSGVGCATASEFPAVGMDVLDDFPASLTMKKLYMIWPRASVLLQSSARWRAARFC